jgi:hypothetical protein
LAEEEAVGRLARARVQQHPAMARMVEISVRSSASTQVWRNRANLGHRVYGFDPRRRSKLSQRSRAKAWDEEYVALRDEHRATLRTYWSGSAEWALSEPSRKSLTKEMRGASEP